MVPCARNRTMVKRTAAPLHRNRQNLMHSRWDIEEAASYPAAHMGSSCYLKLKGDPGFVATLSCVHSKKLSGDDQRATTPGNTDAPCAVLVQERHPEPARNEFSPVAEAERPNNSDGNVEHPCRGAKLTKKTKDAQIATNN